jgi:hypothetical protein
MRRKLLLRSFSDECFAVGIGSAKPEARVPEGVAAPRRLSVIAPKALPRVPNAPSPAPPANPRNP